MAILQQQSSDVRFREIDLSQSLTQGGSSSAGICFASKQGRLGLFHVTSPETFLSEYGNPNAAVSFGHYCALDYLREGRSLWCNRVAGTGYNYAGSILKTVSGSMSLVSCNSVGSDVTDPLSPNWTSLVGGGETALALFYPKRGPGSYANAKLALEILTTNLTTPTGLVTTPSITGGSLGAATYSYQVAAISSTGESLATSVVTGTVASGTTGSVLLTWNAVTGAIGYKIYGRSAGNIKLLTTIGLTGQSGSTVTWTDTGSLTVGTALPITVSDDLVLSDQYILKVYDLAVSNSVPRETWPFTLSDAIDGDGSQLELTQRINPFSVYVNVTSNVSSLVSVPVLSGSTSLVNIDGGLDGATVTTNQIQLGWELFRERENVDVDLLINGGVFDTAVQRTIDSIAQQRATASGLLDIPSTSQSSAQAMIDYRAITLNLNSSYSALFGPDVLEADPYNGKRLYVPFSGWAAALCARTDRINNPWWSIAGLNRGLVNVEGVRYKYGDADRTRLFLNQVNYTRVFQGAGIALWEQVTLQNKTSALSWYSIRRLCNNIKKSVYGYLLYALEEPNDDFLRKQIVDAISQFLDIVQAGRGISKYSVISSADNNPPSLTDAGILKVSVFITPIIPVHEIQLDLIITKQGVEFSEINIANLAG